MALNLNTNNARRFLALRQLWPAIVFWAVLALLPIGRASALPVSIMLIAGIVLAFRQRGALFADRSIQLFMLLFACFWLPIAISAIDAYQADKAWRTTLAMLRYLPVGWFAIWTLRDPVRRAWFSRWSSWLLVVWLIDAIVQAAFGSNLLWMAHPPDRLNGIFDDNMKLGQICAAMSPLLLEHARRHWTTVGFVGSYGLLFTVILLAGTRAGWVMFALVTLCFAVIYARSHGRKFWLSATAMSAAAVLITASAYQLSPTFEQRLDRSLLLFEGDRASIDTALATRLPIWRTSIDMAQQHWVNGVGVRSFRFAYEDFAAADDPWLELMAERGAYHAHQIVLEAATETGVFGVIAWLTIGWLMWLSWQRQSATQRDSSRPFAIALFAVLFPLNTHLAFYSTFWSLVFWWLVIGFVAFAAAEKRVPPK